MYILLRTCNFEISPLKKEAKEASYSQPETSISLAVSPWSWPDSIYSAFLFKHIKIRTFLYRYDFVCLVSNIWNCQANIRILETIIGLRKLSIYMTGVFIQLHSRVIDFSTLLNENLPQYHNIYHKKLRKASVS